MSTVEIKIPAVGESITEATIAEWVKKDGEYVHRDDVLLMLETDKASVEVVAEADGKLKIKVPEGETVEIGTVVGEIDTSAKEEGKVKQAEPASQKEEMPSTPEEGLQASHKSESPAPQGQSPAVRRLAEEFKVDTSQIAGTGRGGRVTKGDVLKSLSSEPQKEKGQKEASEELPPLPQVKTESVQEAQRREPMSRLRQTIARRLVEAQHTAAILTTFNEINMEAVIQLRKKYKETFEKKHGIRLGFMGFFVKAAVEALKAYPRVNGWIEGNDIVYNNYYNIGIAVGTDRGLMVPVVRHADQLSIAEIEMSIKHYAQKARAGKISIEDLQGGTFTISNGGVYGSLMSTPILNPPQSGILGLHKIEERPIAINGEVKIKPMMYVAFSYDHRIIDGTESVGFLVKIKECIEDPARMLLKV
ncbi:MAG: 2-oxoglutarate dehydrogenase complex dihydrolipoyllysine-residue succinyltransferase [Bdellovibrio sp.]|nr:MAG: 2-oxoglutarate dehydrogenase complex dihydrolipoyllysine-residue succinyltransferase [Bdellovibrio sp.]